MKGEIVILSRSLPFHGLGGMEIVAWDLAQAFTRMGYGVRVITTAIPGKSDEFEEKGVRVVPLDAAPVGRYSSSWWRESARYFARNCMASTQVVLSVSAGAYGLLPLRKRLPGVRFILQAHGTSWGEVISKLQSRRLASFMSSAFNLLWLPKDLLSYPKFDAVVAVGERVYRDLSKPPISWSLASDKVHLINNGIDSEIFRPSVEGRRKMRVELNIDDGIPVIVSVSRLHVQKGIQHGLRAFASMLHELPDAIYLIVGDGPEKQNLRSMSDELGISERVRFLGALDRTQLPSVLQASDAFLFLTERIEGLPLNVLEALSCGLKCVISDHLHLFATDRLIMVDPRNPRAVAREIRFALKTEARERRSGLPEEYELSRAALRYLDLFRFTQ